MRDLASARLTLRAMTDALASRVSTTEGCGCKATSRALSGGLDSSAITALAADWLWKTEGERVRTFVTTFAGHIENFRPDDVRHSPDAPYAAAAARHLKSDHIDIVLRTADLMNPETRAATLWAQDRPSTLGDMDTSNYLTWQAIRQRSTVALTGEVSDEIFGGYNWMYNPAFVHGDTFPWVVNESSQPGSQKGQGRGLFDPGIMQKLDMTEYYADNYRQALAEAPHQEAESAEEHRMRSICYLTLMRWLPMLLDRGDRLAMAHGLEMRVPFCDHRLVEYLYNTPWSFKTFDGREKSLLRAAVKDLLPSSVLERKKSPWPVTQDPAYTHALHDELAAMLADRNSPALPFLDTRATQEVLNTRSDMTIDWPSRMNLEMALQFNSWLTRYNVELVI